MDQYTKIEVEVHCNGAPSVFPPCYRLYVDHDLLTERTFIWPEHMYIDEQIVVDLHDGIHEVTVHPCTAYGEFILRNIRVDGKPISGTQFKI